MIGVRDSDAEDDMLFEMKEMTSVCDCRVMSRDSVDVMHPL